MSASSICVVVRLVSWWASERLWGMNETADANQLMQAWLQLERTPRCVFVTGSGSALAGRLGSVEPEVQTKICTFPLCFHTVCRLKASFDLFVLQLARTLLMVGKGLNISCQHHWSRLDPGASDHKALEIYCVVYFFLNDHILLYFNSKAAVKEGDSLAPRLDVYLNKPTTSAFTSVHWLLD